MTPSHHRPRQPFLLSMLATFGVTIALLILSALTATPSGAQSPTGPGGSNSRGGNSPSIAVSAAPTPEQSTSRESAPSSRPCAYFTLDGVGNLPFLVPGLLYEARCPAYNGLPALTRIGPAVYDPVNGLPEPMERARKDLELRALPPLTSPATRALVGTETWFWMPDPTVPLQESVEVGGFTASIFATPQALEIQPGDGSTIQCSITAPPPTSPDQSTNTEAVSDEDPCLHVFKRATRFTEGETSPNFKVTWALRWETNRVRADGTLPGGPLPDGFSIGTFDLEVVEVQAVNTYETPS